MNICDPADVALLARIENSAASDNNDARLSDEDVSRAQALQVQGEAQLRQLSKQLQEIRIAIAPFKRIPPEVLEEIFRAFFPLGRNTMRVVVKLSHLPMNAAPWLLGRVCSFWRRTSRDMPELWGQFYVPIPDIEATNNLKNLMEILPDCAPLSVDVLRTPEAIVRSVIPFLSRVQNLLWSVRDSPIDPSLWNLLPKHAFFKLESLTFKSSSWSLPWLQRRAPSIDGVEMFGLVPNLHRVYLIGDDPYILMLSDFPLDQITTLGLFTNTVTSAGNDRWHESEAVWAQFARQRQFGPQSRLQSLNLCGPQEMLRLFLALQPPLQRLTSLTVDCHLESQFHAIMEFVRQCQGLIEFVFDVLGTTLDAEPTLPHARGIRLPNLRSFCFNIGDTFIFPTFAAPALVDFTISSRKPVDGQAIARHISYSRSKLTKFRCLPYGGELEVTASNTRELLGSLPSCTTFDARQTAMPADVLNDIASSALLPCLKSLAIKSLSSDAFLTMVEHRLEKELRSGRAILEEVFGSVTGRKGNQDDVRLENIRRTYNVRCEVEYLPVVA